MEKKFIKKIDKYIPQHLPKPSANSSFRLNIYAPSYSGKSYLINDMLTNPKYGYSKVYDAERIFIMSPTFESDTSYEKLKKKMKDNPENITDKFDEEMILEILDFQKQMKRQKKMRPVLLLVDDLVTSVNAKRQNEMINLYLRGRHWGISIILTSQKYKYVPSGIRLNADCNIFFSNNMNKKELIDISEECPDDVFLKLANDLRENNYFQYDFIYQNVKHPFNKRYYRGFNKQFKVSYKDL
jgi:hypothetical protein